MSTMVLGIVLGAAGSIFINTGNNLQSLGMAQLEIRENEEAAAEEMAAKKKGEASGDSHREAEIDTCESPVWIVGTVIFISGSILNFVAFAFAPQSILASLEGIQFVTNVLFGKFVLGSMITPMMYAGTLVTIVGVLITVLSASVVGTLEADVSDLLALWANPVWLTYLVCCVLGGGGLLYTHKKYEAAANEGKRLPYAEYMLPVTYATFSALFGTFSVVQAKVLSELVTLQLEGSSNIFWGSDAWFTYVTLVAWLAFVGVWLFRMNEALSLYDPLFIIPLLQVNFILFAIVSGGIYFKEFSYFGVSNVIGFVFGVCLLIVGIFLLSPTVNLENVTGQGQSSAENGGVEMKPPTPKEEEAPQLQVSQSFDAAALSNIDEKPKPVSRMSRAVSFQELRPTTQPAQPASARPSMTKRSISIRNIGEDIAEERHSDTHVHHVKKRTTFINFRFNAVSAMHDNTHDQNIDRAIYKSSLDEAAKADKVAHRRRHSAMPAGASPRQLDVDSPALQQFPLARSASAFDLFSSSPNYPPSRTAFSLSPPSTTSAAAGPSSPKVLKSALKVGGLSNFTPAAMPAHIDEESGEKGASERPPGSSL